MKAILTLIIILSFGINAIAQPAPTNQTTIKKVEVILKEDVKLNNSLPLNQKMARLYLFKNSRVKKELAFRTKANRAKLA